MSLITNTQNRSRTIESPAIMLLLIPLVSICALGIARISWNPLVLLASFAVGGILALTILTFAIVLNNNKPLIQPATIFVTTSLGYALSAIFLLSGAQSRSYRYILTPENVPHFTEALGYALAGMISFLISYAFLIKEKERLASRICVNENEIHISRERVTRVVTVFYSVGLIGYYLFVQSSGGIRILLEQTGKRNILRTTEYYRTLFQLTLVAGWIWFAYDKRALKKPLFWVQAIVTVLFLMSLGNRGAVIIYVATYLVIGIYRSTKAYKVSLSQFLSRLPSIILVMVFSLSVMFGGLAWREASYAANRSGGGVTIDLFFERLARYQDGELLAASLFGQSNLAGIESLATIVEIVPDELAYMRGQSFIWTFLMPIPRAIWPNKPTTLGLHIKRTLWSENAIGGGVPPGITGELFLNFGLVGVIIGNSIFGYCSGRVYLFYIRHSEKVFAQLFYIFYSTVFVFYLTKTEFRTGLYRFIVVALALYAVNQYILRNQKNSMQSRLDPASSLKSFRQ